MISGMDTLTAPPPPSPDPASAAWRLPAVLAGVAGCLLLVMATSPWSSDSLESYLDMTPYNGGIGPSTVQGWILLAAPAVATALGLFLSRWWPYLLTAAALMFVPSVMAELSLPVNPFSVLLLSPAGFYLALIALLACAQGLIRVSVRWGAAIAALALGARLVGDALSSGLSWAMTPHTATAWHVVLLVLGLAGLAPALWRFRRGDPNVMGAADGRSWSWQRARVIVAGTLAACVPIPLALLTTQHLADLLGVDESALVRHSFAQAAVLGAITLVVVAVLAGVAGLWPLGGALTVGLVQVAVVVPVSLGILALQLDDPVRWLAAAGGAVLGAVGAATRWRVAVAATLTASAGAALFIAYGATTGDPEKLADQHIVIPSVLILVLCVASLGAVVGATAPVLAARAALPAVLGPLAGTLAVGGLAVTQATYGMAQTVGLTPLQHVTTSAGLLLVAGAAVGGLGFAQVLASRRAERKHAEQIRREAAAAERDRLARPIHDGVLQVLALVQRHGSELGGQGGELAALAGEQEIALRSLLTREASAGRNGAEDLRSPLQALATTTIEVVTPAQPVPLPAAVAAEVTAAVRAALDNVRQHAGDGAHTWILLEDERDGVRVTVRDDGVGFPPQRPAEAAEAGRLGIAQSMRGRIADHGGTTTIHSTPDEGTEVEFWIPRSRPPRGER
jgi:signal transduction histidine kinase